ncbi:metallophosphoesterase family protein [Rathayibacter toxicus]|uniref:metallophosphoesterase family protein n=1 Tax=Rathayibacter toxicus TaxID=145458 RepID=UPI001C0440A6|nr:metallophosphoesterase family protein [Rathayibacter toxicus]QWL30955.1 hypothetical protein E2R34_09515 [Rathayibacter toxicus]
MLIGLLSDAHSDVLAVHRALEELDRHGADMVIALGDMLECHVPRDGGDWGIPLTVATSWAQQVADLLTETHVLRGNQEERIIQAIDRASLSVEVDRLLRAESGLDRGDIRYQHGHRFEWVEWMPDRWIPDIAVAPEHIVVHGHHHRNSVIAVDQTATGDRDLEDLTAASGCPVILDRARGHIINVGPAQTDHPSWALLDDEKRSVTLHYRQRRFRR